jgi:hypothetical protein
LARVIPIRNTKLRTPGPADRMVNIGRTGSGKTYAGLWHLSNASFDVRPYVIIDPKLDKNLMQLDAQEIELGYVPKFPGLYITHPLPTQESELDSFLMSLWDRENVGVYADEAFMCGKGPGFVACLTQGRSKHIPMILNTQRPVEVSRFVFSEASFFQVFGLTDKRDKQTVKSFAPIPDLYHGERMPEFWSHYYDVSKDALYVMRPVPRADASIERINTRLEAMQEKQTQRRYL